MEVFQNLKIYVPEDKEELFIKGFFNKLKSSNWTHKTDFEAGYKKNTASTDDLIICIETDDLKFSNQTLKGFVWMWKKKNYFEVFNIIPSKSGSLTYGQYNFILNTFYDNLLSDIVRELELKTEVSNPNKSIIDLIGKDAGDALLKFSKSANKSTGNSHPYDFNRWCDFVFIIHRKEIPLNIDDFVRWLEEEENWTNDIAWKLGLDLEYALNILEKYEQN